MPPFPISRPRVGLWQALLLAFTLGLGAAQAVVVSTYDFEGGGGANGTGLDGWNIITTGVGNDLVAFYANTVRAALSAVTSAGQDTIGLRQANDFQSSAVFNGAGGVDTLASDGSGAAPTVVAVENNNNAVLDGLIDDVLADFDDLSLDI